MLTGTEGAWDLFFSPDDDWIGFSAEGKLKKISVRGGAAVTLASLAHRTMGAWDRDGSIIGSLDLFRLPVAGGQPVQIGRAEELHPTAWRYPQIQPGDQVSWPPAKYKNELRGMRKRLPYRTWQRSHKFSILTL